MTQRNKLEAKPETPFYAKPDERPLWLRHHIKNRHNYLNVTIFNCLDLDRYDEGIEYLAKRQHFKISSDTDAFLFHIFWSAYRDDLMGGTYFWVSYEGSYEHTYLYYSYRFSQRCHHSPYHKHPLHLIQAL